MTPPRPGAPDVSALPAGVLGLSDDFRILWANRRVGDLVDRAPEALIGSSVDVLLSSSSRILFQTHVYPALAADGRVEEVFLTVAGPGGQLIPVLFNATRSPKGDGSAFQAVIVRILARARWEQDLLAATRELGREREASERLTLELSKAIDELTAREQEERRNHEFRDAFIGVVSHELRTPITTIFGMSHVLRERFATMDAATVSAHLEDIVAESDRLRRLTEDLLVLSRAEGRKLDVAREPLLLDHLAQRITGQERARAGTHSIRLTTTGDLPLALGEEVYVEQVLRNLVSNAVKYSPAGSAVDVQLRPEDDGVAVRVIDAGPGLPEHGRERLFDVFHREPDAIRQTPGAGIGLFVCRALIDAMGGRLWAADAPPPSDHGAEFGFWLPSATDEGLDGAL